MCQMSSQTSWASKNSPALKSSTPSWKRRDSSPRGSSLCEGDMKQSLWWRGVRRNSSSLPLGGRERRRFNPDPVTLHRKSKIKNQKSLTSVFLPVLAVQVEVEL